MKRVFVIFVFSLLLNGIHSQVQEISYSLADRDRLIQVEAEIKSIRNEINVQFNSVNNRLNSQGSMMYWGFGILLSLMLFMLGFIIQDRRTT